jgi:hypothetical protein
VGVGAQRSGTTWWFDLITAHPEVSAPVEKEWHFFNAFCTTEMTDEHLAAYRSGFQRERGQIAGEWTPRYAYDFWTPPLLRRAAPEAKLLFLMRDPLARLRSGIEHQSRLTPPRDAAQFAHIFADAAARGLYGAQLHRLLEHFPREQVLVLQYEQCVADTGAQLRRTYRYLGIDEDFRPNDLRQASEAPRSDRLVPLPAAAHEAFLRAATADLVQLVSCAPEIDPALWPTFSGLRAGEGIRTPNPRFTRAGT